MRPRVFGNTSGQASENPGRRDAYFTAVENMVCLALRPAPVSRQEWHLALDNVKVFLAEIFCVTHSQRHGELIKKKFAEMLDEGLLEIDRAIRKVEEEKVEGGGAQTQRDESGVAQQNRVLQSQVAALAARVSHNEGRGGRGGGRGGGRDSFRGRGRWRGGGEGRE